MLSRFMPSSHGAVAHLGTDLAHHFLLSCIDFATVMELNVFILFVDLTQAFDKILRELVFGWPSHFGDDRESREAYLVECGVSVEMAS